MTLHNRALSWRALFLLALLWLASTGPLAAQEPAAIAVSDTIMEVRLADGSTLFGRVVEADGDRIVVVTESGARVEFSRSQIAEIGPLQGTLHDGEVWPDDRNVSRLLFAPTGRTLPAGTGYFGVFELILPFVSYGIGDAVTLSGGTPVLPEAIGQVFYLAPKVRVVSAPPVQVSAGVLAFFATEEIDEGPVGILYGVGTFGSPDRALTLGAGWPFIAGDDSEIADEPIVLVGGEIRTSQHTKLITENYFVFGESGAIVSGGVRLFGERLSADVGLGAFLDEEDGGCCLPVVNFVYSFGDPKPAATR